MKSVRLLAAAAVIGLGLAGCAGTIDSITTGLNNLFVALSSSAATQSAKNLRSWSTAVACFVANGTAAARQIETAISAKQAAVTTTGNIYTVSELVCTSLGGTPGATVPVAK